MQFRGFSVLSLAAASVVGALAIPAQAALVLDLQNGGIVVQDNLAGDNDPTVGIISNSSSIAGFTFQITVAQSNSPGVSTGGTLGVVNLQVTNVSNPGTASLVITATDDGFALPAAGVGGLMQLSGSAGGTFTVPSAIGDSVKFQSFVDPSNDSIVGDADEVSTALLQFFRGTNAATEAYSGNDVVNWTRAGAYSLRSVITTTLSPGGTVQVTGTTVATPEPGVLGSLCLAGAMFIRRRR